MKQIVPFTVFWLVAVGWLWAVPPEGGRSAHQPSGRSRPDGPEWEILFEDGITNEEYARQIDFFQIEIAAVSKKGKTDYISQVSRPKPARHVGYKASDYRFNTTWKVGTLHAADRKLLTKAGVSSDGKELLHYFPIDVQSQLSKLERAYANRQPAEIKRTRFQIRPQDDAAGYTFVVVEQDPPKSTREPPSTPSQNKPAGP